jgi:probable F420-dependent oxidoreductase
MRYGATLFATDRSIHPVPLARAMEERGFDSLWVPEHTHIPVSRLTPAPTGDPELAEEYLRSLDPFVSLTVAAAVTTRLRVGTGIALVAQRDPIVTAKAAASLDWISGGRFTLGVGYGWNFEEMADHGVDPRTRRARTRDHVLAMRRLWEDETASYAGEYFHLSESWAWPKPVQRPLPVLIGGAPGPTLFAHIAEFAEGWIPIGGHGLAEALPQLRAAMEVAGRDPSTVEVVPFGSIPHPAKLEYFERVGVTQCVFRLPSAPESVVMPLLDRYAGLISEMGASA